MKEIKEKNLEPVQEAVAQPTDKEIIDLLSQKVIQQDATIKEQAKAVEELTAAKEDLCVECKVLKEELDTARRELEEYTSIKACECRCDTDGRDKPWEKKRKLMFEAVQDEISWYEAHITLLKHDLIECPDRKHLIKAEIKDAKNKVKKLKRIMKAVVK
jgi:predicted  nucleic acid-binding Zn-ribbon protein